MHEILVTFFKKTMEFRYKLINIPVATDQVMFEVSLYIRFRNMGYLMLKYISDQSYFQ